jgi:hypothetical protein
VAEVESKPVTYSVEPTSAVESMKRTGIVATDSTHAVFELEHTEAPGQTPQLWPETTPHTAPACEHASATHWPFVGSQRWPAAQVTPVQRGSH